MHRSTLLKLLKDLTSSSHRSISTTGICRQSESATILPSYLSFPPAGGDTSQGNATPPLFITHGLLGSKINWNSIAKALAKSTNRQVITFDARNHGDSPHTDETNYDLMARDVLHLASHLNVHQFSLMGHSMGGRTAMTFALRYPEKLDKLVVVDVSPTVMSADFSQMEKYLRTLLGQVFKEKLVLSNARKIVDQVLTAVTEDRSIRAFLLTNLATTKDGKVFWKPNVKALLKNLEFIGTFPKDLIGDEHVYDGPTLFIRGGKSAYIPDSDLPNLKRKFPASDVVTIANAGHWPHAENAPEFISAVNRFLN